MKRKKLTKPKIFRGWNAWCVLFCGDMELDAAAARYINSLPDPGQNVL